MDGYSVCAHDPDRPRLAATIWSSDRWALPQPRRREGTYCPSHERASRGQGPLLPLSRGGGLSPASSHAMVACDTHCASDGVHVQCSAAMALPEPTRKHLSIRLLPLIRVSDRWNSVDRMQGRHLCDKIIEPDAHCSLRIAKTHFGPSLGNGETSKCSSGQEGVMIQLVSMGLRRGSWPSLA